MCKVVAGLFLCFSFTVVQSVEVRPDEIVCVDSKTVSFEIFFAIFWFISKWPPKEFVDWFRPAVVECRTTTGVTEGPNISIVTLIVINYVFNLPFFIYFQRPSKLLKMDMQLRSYSNVICIASLTNSTC